MQALRDTLVERFQAELADRYAFERELGRGGMASVYLARDLKHDRPVAVKILSPDLTTSLGTERFLREIRIVARLQHPNILPLLDSGEAAGLAFFVMPYVEGESLRERLALNGMLSPLESVRLARAVVSGLGYAHGKGVVHRDIKPENLLISGGTAVIADFGVARAAAEAGATTLTVGGSAIGTPAYMSPEQAAGEPTVDGRSDLYSLGCVLFEMLAGRPPFTGSTAQRIMSQHLTATPPSLATLRPGLSPALVRTVERCLSKSPDERFATAGELDEQLRLLIAGEVLQASTPSGGGPPPPRLVEGGADETLVTSGRSASRRPLLVGGMVLAAVLLGLVLLRPASRQAASKVLGSGRGDLASVAALPLDNFGDPTQNYLSEGLTEEIIAQLSRIERLKVISRTSATAIKARGLTIPQIASLLRVEHIVEGSVQKSGDRLRVTLQLIEARTDRHLWAETFDRQIDDALALREEVGRKVTQALLSNVKALRAPEPAPGPPRVARSAGAAFDAYLQGTYCLQRPSPEMLKGAIGDFRRALEIDHGYAPAYVGLAAARRLGVLLGTREMGDAYAAMTQALRDAEKARELDPALAEAWAERGLVALFSGAPAAEALADFEKAIKLSPSSGPARLAYGLGLYHAGQPQRAVQEMERSLDLDPLCPAVRAGGVGLTNLAIRRYDMALKHARAALENHDETGLGRLAEGTALLLLGRLDELESLDLAPWPELKAMLLHARGRTLDARALLLSLDGEYRSASRESPSGGVHVHTAVLAAAWAWVGDGARAREWIDRSFDEAPQGTDPRLLDSGLFDRLEDRATLAALVAERRKKAWLRVSAASRAAP